MDFIHVFIKLILKNLNLCFKNELRSYGFGITWGWLNDDRIFIFVWTIPLTAYVWGTVSPNSCTFQSIQLHSYGCTCWRQQRKLTQWCFAFRCIPKIKFCELTWKRVTNKRLIRHSVTSYLKHKIWSRCFVGKWSWLYTFRFCIYFYFCWIYVFT